MRLLITALALFIFCLNAAAQVLPAEAATLNYTLAPFSIPATGKNDSCIFEIAIGHHQTAATFDKNIVISQYGKKDKTIILLPYFNSEYTWRYREMQSTQAGELHHFKIGYSKFTDSNYYKTRIIQTPAVEVGHIYIFNDYLRTLSTPVGQIVWYLPHIPDVIDDNTLVRDLKPTSTGTLTFLTHDGAYEIDYNGNILWKAPNDGKISGAAKENYHHELTKLPNGHYMVSGTQSVERHMPPSLSGGEKEAGIAGSTIVQYETLIEYDAENNVAWSWKASEHIPDSVLFSKTNPDGKTNTSMHLNSFYYHEKEQCIYAGFRDISSIIKISYPSGKILNIYKGNAPATPQLFKSQHSCRVDDNGNLYLYSNNNPAKNESRGKDEKECVSAITTLQETNGQLIKTWEFQCNIDNYAMSCTNSGGSIHLLQTGDFLVSMGSVNRNFIVNKEKKILWNAVTEKKDGDAKWVPAGTYRISCIETNTQMEVLLFQGR